MRGLQIGDVARNAVVEAVGLHVLRGRLEVADRKIFGAQSFSDLYNFGEVGNIAFHRHKGNANFRDRIMAGFPHFTQAFQVIQNSGKFGADADIGVRFGGRAIQGNPQHIQACVNQFTRFLLGKSRAVGDEFNFNAKFLDAPNPFDGLGMEERLANAAKINAGDGVHLFQAIDDAFERCIGHAANGLIPRIAEAGDAIEVAGHGRLDVDFGQLRDGTMHPHKVMAFVEANLRAGIQPVLPGNFGRKDEASAFVHFGPGGG